MQRTAPPLPGAALASAGRVGLRDSLSGLTFRGRTFLAGGLTAVVAAALTGQPSVVAVGTLAASLPLLAALWMSRTRQAVLAERTITPHRITAGGTANIEVRITNVSATSTGVMMLEDEVPSSLGAAPRFVVDGLRRDGMRRLSYRVRSDHRGRHEIGPLKVRLADPFGLVEVPRRFTQVVPLTVLPRIVALPPIRVGGSLTGVGENRPHAFAVGSAEDVTVRDYRRGDDMRRVHWRSTARRGELMVRREEQPWQASVRVHLDNRARAHRGRTSSSTASFEAAVSIAASLVTHLSSTGSTVDLSTTEGSASNERGATGHLDALAVVEPTLRDVPAGETTGRAGAPSGPGGLVVGVFGAVDARDHASLARMARQGGTAVAFVLDVDAWAAQSDATGIDAALGVMRAAGWRAVALSPRDDLATAWQRLGASAVAPLGGHG